MGEEEKCLLPPRIPLAFSVLGSSRFSGAIALYYNTAVKKFLWQKK